MARVGSIGNEAFIVFSETFAGADPVCEIQRLSYRLTKDDLVENDRCSAWKQHILGMRDLELSMTIIVKRDDDIESDERGDLSVDSFEHVVKDDWWCEAEGNEYLANCWIVDKWGDGVFIPGLRVPALTYDQENDGVIKVEATFVVDPTAGDPEPVLLFTRASCQMFMTGV